MGYDLSPEAARFLPIAKSIASQVHRALVPDVDLKGLMELAEKGLSEGCIQFRPRQGLTLRTYLIYRIQIAIYAGLSDHKWRDEDARKQYVFEKKSSELLLNFQLSAEGAVKRSTKAEQEEVSYLVRLLTIVALLAPGKKSGACREAVETLDSAARNFIRLYYDQDLSMPEVSEKMGLTVTAANRLHIKILEKIAYRLTEVS